MKRWLILIIGLVCLQACNKHEPITLKLMTYNIRHGEGMDGVYDLSRAAGIINGQKPDLCGLQEIDHYCRRSDSIDQTEFLAKATGMDGSFGKFMNFQGGEYGMATLSALSVLTTTVLSLPDGKYEPRTSIVHEILFTETDTILFANVHFEWISGDTGVANRLAQAKTLLKHIDQTGHASIIVGDFNSPPKSPCMQYFTTNGFMFADQGRDLLSYQGKTKADIDHIIFRGTEKLSFKTKQVQLLDEPIASDHQPLVVEMKVELN